MATSACDLTPATAVPRIGIAGWSIPAPHREQNQGDGSHLQRYARRFNAVEINSSFYRPHRRETYERWSASVPADFRFAAKVPKLVTHERRLKDCNAELLKFLSEIGGLGEKLRVLLVQLPPSLAFELPAAGDFFSSMRDASSMRCLSSAQVACEPRHATWFSPQADELLQRFNIARVAADPPRAAANAAEPGGDLDLVYYRLHGSPKIYYSSYEAAFLTALHARIEIDRARGRSTWCIFDNTAEFAAWSNALELQDRLYSRGPNAKIARP